MTIKLVSAHEVEKFIVSFKLPHAVATSILKTAEDCATFLEFFYKKNRRLTDDLLDYRLYKIECSPVTLDMFLSACDINRGLSWQYFESVFFEDFCEADMKRIVGAIINHRITLEQLFSNFQKDPDTRIMQYLV